MPYLNWKETQLRKSVSERERGRSVLQLAVSVSDAQALAESLSAIYSAEAGVGPELRVDLPDEWILFFKLRESESRLLLAHPQKDEWVSTLALEREHGAKVIGALRALRSGEKIEVHALGSVGGVSNVNILIEGL